MSITFIARAIETYGPSIVLKTLVKSVYWHVTCVSCLTVMSTSALCKENTSLSMQV